MTKTFETAKDVIRCDQCGAPLDELGLAMLFWQEGGRLVLAHKKCASRRTDLPLSRELVWFADHEASLRGLLELTQGYKWHPDDLQRLVCVAWAVPLVATAEEQADAARSYKLRREMGM
jgi:hypothetical protein